MTNSFYRDDMTVSDAFRKLEEDVDFAIDIISSYRIFEYGKEILDPKKESRELLFDSLVDKPITQAFHLSGMPKHLVACWDPRTVGNPGENAPDEYAALWVIGDNNTKRFTGEEVYFYKTGKVEFRAQRDGIALYSPTSLNNLFKFVYGDQNVDS